MAMRDMPRVVTTPVIDVPVAFPQKPLRILCIEWQVWIDAGVDLHSMPIDVH
jgi:hypothetical protein